MDEIHALLEKAHSRLQVARELFENGHFEDSVSRAYYSMVAAASAGLRLKDMRVKTHRGLQTIFQEVFIRSGEIEEEMGRLFRFSEDMRNRADYHTFETISDEQAELIINDAELFISRIEELINAT